MDNQTELELNADGKENKKPAKKASKKRKSGLDENLELYLEEELHTTYNDFLHDAVWEAVRDLVENRNSALRKEIEQKALQEATFAAYRWMVDKK